MIKLMNINSKDPGGYVITAFADTKDEVPETGSATVVSGHIGKLSPPALCCIQPVWKSPA